MRNHKPTFKLPGKIILLGEIYDIKFEELKDCLGDITPEKKLIRLSPSLKNNPEELTYVFFHEIGHYFASLVGVKDDDPFASLYSYFLIAILKQLGYEQK